MEGRALVEMVVEFSGLPREWALNQMYTLIESRGLPVESIQLDQVRDLLGEMLQEIILNETGS